VYCVILCVLLLPRVLFYCVCIAVLRTLVAGLLVRIQYSEGPETGHLGTGFSWFPFVYKQMLRRFPIVQAATVCFSCSPPDLYLLDSYFIFMLSLFHIHVLYMHSNHCHRVTVRLQSNTVIPRLTSGPSNEFFG